MGADHSVGCSSGTIGTEAGAFGGPKENADVGKLLIDYVNRK